MAVARLLGIFILLFYLKVTCCQQGLEVQNIGLHIVPNVQGAQKFQIQNPSQGITSTPQQTKQQQAWQQQQALQLQQALQQHQAIQHDVIQQQQISQQQTHHQQQTAQQQKAIQQQQAIQLQQALQEQQAVQQQQAILKQQQQQTLQQQQAMQQQQALQQQQVLQQQQTMQQQQVLQQQRAMQQQQAVQQQQALQQQALQQQVLEQQQALQQSAIQQQVMQPVNLQTNHQSLNLYSPNKLQTVSVQSPQGLPPFNLQTANLQLQGPNSEINIASLPNVKLSTPQPNAGTASASKNIPTIQFTSLKFIPVVDQKSTALLQNQGVPSAPEIKNIALTQTQCGNNQITPNSLNLQQTQNIPVQNCHKLVGPLNQLPSVNFNSLHTQPSLIAQSQLPLQSHSTFMLQNPTLSAGQSQLNTLPSPPIISSFNQPSLALQNSLVQTLPKVPSLAVPPQIPVSTIQSPPVLPSIQNTPIFSEIRNLPIVPSIQNQPLYSSIPNQALTGPIQVQPQISTPFNSPTLTLQNQPTFISPDRIQNQNVMSIQNPPTITVQNPSIFPSVQNQPLFLATQPNMNMQTQPTLSPLSNQISIQTQNPTILNQNHQLQTSIPSQQMILPQTFTAFQNPPASTSIQLQSPMTPQNQLMSLQNQPTISTVQTQSMPSMPTVSTVQSVPITMTANQPSVIPLQSPAYSIILPPVQSESAHPYLTVSPAISPPAPVKQSKSSSLKSLVPLLINILKERSCGCHNCNCMNKNNHEPTVHGGYSNQKSYGPLPNEPSFLPEVATEPAELFRASRSDNVSVPKDYIKNVIDDESLEDFDDDSEYVDDEDE